LGAGAGALQVSGIMMNEYTGKDVTTKLHEEQWLSPLQASSTEVAKERAAISQGHHHRKRTRELLAEYV
jgi:hypothetical protein